MCGRYTFTMSDAELAAEYGVEPPADHTPRYNVAPSQPVAVVGRKPDGAGRGLVRMRWGFVPRWATDPDAGPKPINAKAETVATKPPFRDSFQDRRCLIPMTGFYEWEARGGKKWPHYFRPTVAPVAFAGVWDVWKRPDRDAVYSCAVLTVPANAVVGRYHDRMPALLTAGDFDRWLDRAALVDDLAGLLKPFPADLLTDTPVNPAVNSPRSDGPECLTPAG